MEEKNGITNTLFNEIRMESYIDRYNDELMDNVNIEAITVWIEKLDNNELKDEKTNYITFFKQILEQLLGYQDSDIKHEKNIGNEGHPVEFTLNKDGKDYVVVELKGTTYKDLTKRKNGRPSPVEQGSNYASAKKETQWAIVSNYDEFRLFNPISREDYISFNFRQLTDENVLKKFLLVFSKFSLIDEDIPRKLLEETKVIERKLEDEFYQLYSETRWMLIKELEYSSENINRIEAIRLAQLILNRYIFLCFAEDLLLIDDQTTTKTILLHINSDTVDEYRIWEELCYLFRFANIGKKNKQKGAFNGGLFKEDLKHLKIRDEIEDDSIFGDFRKEWDLTNKYDDILEMLGDYKDTINPIYRNLLMISSCNFKSDLDVNILGHIFENSIGDIEELKDENQEQRKKDGVYYTPEYITDYICRNTIIPYLSIDGEAKTVHELLTEYEATNSLEELDFKLENIKILDPACGSGSMLNKAADILFEIHEALYSSKWAGDSSLDRFKDSLESRKKIISNNIYGVDLNEESVEITKLSLFLKLATSTGVKQGFKLPNIDKNIKCGNSLVDDELIAGEKAFNWNKEFSEVFENGGFDIIIGNPPYIRVQEIEYDLIDYLNDNYQFAYNKLDMSILFIELAYKILKEKGNIGIITSNMFLTSEYGREVRKTLLNDIKILKIIDFGDLDVFLML